MPIDQRCTPFAGLLAIGLRLDKKDFPTVVGSNARVGGRESPVMFRGDASSAHLSANSRIMNGVEKEDRHGDDSSGRTPAKSKNGNFDDEARGLSRHDASSGSEMSSIPEIWLQGV